MYTKHIVIGQIYNTICCTPYIHLLATNISLHIYIYIRCVLKDMSSSLGCYCVRYTFVIERVILLLAKPYHQNMCIDRGVILGVW